MSQYNQNFYANGMRNGQQPNQSSQALYNYCIVMRKPKLGAAPVVITILEGVVITLVTALLGVKLWKAVVIGAIVSAVFAFICWLAYRVRSGSSKRLNSYIAADGGQATFETREAEDAFFRLVGFPVEINFFVGAGGNAVELSPGRRR